MMEDVRGMLDEARCRDHGNSKEGDIILCSFTLLACCWHNPDAPGRLARQSTRQQTSYSSSTSHELTCLLQEKRGLRFRCMTSLVLSPL